MREKLQKFTAFADSLLPHETEFLLQQQQFADTVKLEILEKVNRNSHRLTDRESYDTGKDKRKFSHLKNWIEDRLQSIDVDREFEWLCQIEQRIMTDHLDPQEERALLRRIRQFEPPTFYFTKFYELVESYRHFLLIRLRQDDHQLADEFIQQYRALYLRSRSVGESMHKATVDIIDHYSNRGVESRKWEEWLTEVFYDETMDGLNRYLALVRLTFIYLNYRQLDPLRAKFDYLDALFREGRYYSKRLLLNYYHNRLLLHTRYEEYDRAIYYGYLAVRQKNNDYLLYLNNLSAVLLRCGRAEDALELLRQGLPDMKSSQNFFNKVGYVGFYVQALTRTGKLRAAENYAEVFLQAYRSQVLKYRWHLFFSAYLQSLLYQGRFMKVVRTVRKYQLLDRDRRYQHRAGYLPTIQWYNDLAEYREGHYDRAELQRRMVEQAGSLQLNETKWPALKELVREFDHFEPGLMPPVLSTLERNLAARS